MTAPANFVEHLKQEAYHPRSSKHGNALCQFILADLLAYCPKIAVDAAARRLVFCRNRQIIVGNSNWNVDLVLGPPPGGFVGSSNDPIEDSPPAAIRVALEAKSIMTEHGKARRNRMRDLDSLHQFVHRNDPHAITAAVTVVNVASQFRSPLRSAVTTHRNIRRLVEETITLMRTLPASIGAASGLDAHAVILVDHDNVDSSRTSLVTSPPAPQTGDPLNYDSFLRRVCDYYGHRWP